jgi:carboxypeptidase C (cathepsin A)
MGAYGPYRIVTAPAPNHTPAAPYRIVPNHQSLLNATDEVFIDAPATGFSRLLPDGNPKDYFGIDQDGHAFADFIVQFLSKFNRWNSPKYLYGGGHADSRPRRGTGSSSLPARWRKIRPSWNVVAGSGTGKATP